LEREIGIAGVGKREVGSVASTLPSSHFPLPSSAERALLLVLLAGEAWRARVLETVDADDFDTPALREVFEAERGGTAAELGGEAAQAYEKLRAQPLEEQSVSDVFEGAMKHVNAKPLDRRIDSIDKAMTVAGPEEQRRLMLKKQQLTAERNAVKPTYKIVSRRKGAPGS
jgi:hypothetical protein